MEQQEINEQLLHMQFIQRTFVHGHTARTNKLINTILQQDNSDDYKYLVT